MHTVTCRHKPGLVGILSGDLGRWAEWTGSMFKMIFPTGSNYKWVRGNGFALNRNIIVRTLLENQHWEWLWFMDDDHVFDGDLVLRLLERDVDIIQPLVSTRKAPFQPYAYEWDATENSYVSMDWPQLQPDGIQQVDAVGCGGMLVRRRVFEAMSDPWFEEGKTSAEHIGEDLYFCTKARELGFGIYVDLDNKMGHMGTYHVWPQRHNGDWANKLVYNEVSMVVPWSFGRDLAAEEEANGSLQRSGA